MFQILILIVLTIGILSVLRLSNNKEGGNKYKNYFNKSKEIIFIICMIIISYSINNCENMTEVNTNIPEVFTDNVKF
jgi:hypothetical protein